MLHALVACSYYILSLLLFTVYSFIIMSPCEGLFIPITQSSSKAGIVLFQSFDDDNVCVCSSPLACSGFKFGTALVRRGFVKPSLLLTGIAKKTK